jgi:hypothetical protein
MRRLAHFSYYYCLACRTQPVLKQAIHRSSTLLLAVKEGAQSLLPDLTPNGCNGRHADLSKIEAGRMTIECTPFCTRKPVDRALGFPFPGLLAHTAVFLLHADLSKITWTSSTLLSSSGRRWSWRLVSLFRSLFLIVVVLLHADLSKIEAGHMEIECTPFSIRETVETVLGLFGDKARQKNLELAAIVQDAVPATLVGDSVRVRQILINLVSNALKVGVCSFLSIMLNPAVLHCR